MKNEGFLGICVVVLVLCGTSLAAAQELDRYRQFVLGSDVATVSAVAGNGASEPKVIHQRPALIQELTWRPRYGAYRPAAANTESVEQIVFTFHENQLFQVTVDYDQAQTEGLSNADMIEAVSVMYGLAVKPSQAKGRLALSVYDDPGTLVAQWATVDNSVTLYRLSSYSTKFRMVVMAEPVGALARTAAARSVVLDAREAPAREAARVKKDADDRRIAEEEARSTNKATFRP